VPRTFGAKVVNALAVAVGAVAVTILLSQIASAIEFVL